jgi:hypothetical protein
MNLVCIWTNIEPYKYFRKKKGGQEHLATSFRVVPTQASCQPLELELFD